MYTYEQVTKAFPPSQFVGFDDTFKRLIRQKVDMSSTYPPHNIVKLTTDTYKIELAVAGFEPDRLKVTQEDRSLTIESVELDRGEDEVEEDVEMLHRGISARNFSRKFTLADYVEVKDTTLRNGILAVTIERKVPKKKQPRDITIKQV